MRINRALSHPGEILYDIYMDSNLSPEELSDISGIDKEKIKALIMGKEHISVTMAEGFSKAFGSTTSFWLNLQYNYDEHKKLYPQYYK